MVFTNEEYFAVGVVDFADEVDDVEASFDCIEPFELVLYAAKQGASGAEGACGAWQGESAWRAEGVLALCGTWWGRGQWTPPRPRVATMPRVAKALDS